MVGQSGVVEKSHRAVKLELRVFHPEIKCIFVIGTLKTLFGGFGSGVVLGDRVIKTEQDYLTGHFAI